MKFAIHISTKNRKDDLIHTLNQIRSLCAQSNVECVVFDDGSTDGTLEAVKNQFSQITLLRNETSRGYIYCRNKMLNETQADYAVSLDDDAHFLSEKPLEIIESYFKENSNCGLIAFRIYWSKTLPVSTITSQKPERVKSYVGCGHAWRMAAWRSIPNYPEWFEFYGEESFASLQLFKNNWEIQYLPSVFIQHRVDLKQRKNIGSDFALRYRRGIRAGWFNVFLFYPFFKGLQFFGYSLWMQFKTKILKGNFRIVLPLLSALFDLIYHFPKILKQRNTFTRKEFATYAKLKEPKIYWKPEN
ncbi:MAG: glycosyltransferase [Flavobacterium sp.]|nr:glycosyltransferase [Flavobacterium sp.]MBP8157601.1 glycosyltransferase [Flavobacterium sp.]